MANEFYRTYDDCLEDALTYYKDLDPTADRSVGSPTYIRACNIASMVYGLYRYGDFTCNQVFPDTCDTESLNHIGNIYNIQRDNVTQTDQEYALKIIAALQEPPAGGTKNDFYNWAVHNDIEVQANGPLDFAYTAVSVANNQITITQDWVDGDTVRFTTTGTLPSPLAVDTDYTVVRVSSTLISLDGITLTDQGAGIHTIISQNTLLYSVEDATVITYDEGAVEGTVEIVLKPNVVAILDPSNNFHTAIHQLVSAVQDYIDNLRPVTSQCRVMEATLYHVPIVIIVYPITAPVIVIKDDIQAYLDGFKPGEKLIVAMLESICIDDGCDDAEVTYPAANVVPTLYQLLWSSSITITAHA